VTKTDLHVVLDEHTQSTVVIS